jgi:hypothetical protein
MAVRHTSESEISFDPTNIRVRFGANEFGQNQICMDGLPVKIYGKHWDVKNFCIANSDPSTVPISIHGVDIAVALLGSNTNEAAWLIGLKPAEGK